MPNRLRDLRELFVHRGQPLRGVPARRPGHRAGEPGHRRPPRPAPRAYVDPARAARAGRLTEEAAPNVKNRSHVVTVTLDARGGDQGVLVAQGGRFGGWSLYCVDGAAVVRLQLLRPRPDHGPGRAAAAAGAARGHAAVRLRRRAARRRARTCRCAWTARRWRPATSRRPPPTTSPSTRPATWASTGARPVTDDYAPVHNAFTGRIPGSASTSTPRWSSGPEVRRRMTTLIND